MLCEICSDYTHLSCTACKPNAYQLSTSGSCQCLDRFYKQDETESCEPCFEKCATCSNKHNGDCVICEVN